MRSALVLALALAVFWTPARCENVGFVETDGLRFVLNGQTYYYTGAYLWYGLNLASAGPGGDRDRLERELDNLVSLGITNLRIMAGSEGPNTEPWRMVPALQTDPGVYDPEVLDGLDYLLKAMDDRELRAVMCLSNFWNWSGGFAQYVSWNGGGPIPYPPPEPGGDWNVFQDYSSDFYSNAGAKQDYLDYVSFIINRVNPYSGVAYKDDPTIMAWELANEPRGFHNNEVAFNQWIDDAAAYIKSLDSNHLVTTGCEGDTPWPDWHGLDFVANHDGPDIDYATIAVWPQGWFSYDPTDPEGTYAAAEASSRSYFNTHEAIAAGTLGKPLALEEFGVARDGGSFDPASTTVWRDMFFAAMYDEVYASASVGGPGAGEHFTAWAGEGRPVPPYGGYWAPGDPWTGDPPHTEQGLYGVYDIDATTLAAISSHSDDMRALNPVVTDVAIENLTLSHTNDYVKNTDSLQLTATVTDNEALSASDITADLSTLLVGGGSAVPAEGYASNIATWTAALAGVTLESDGLKTVTVTATDGLGNTGSDSDDITVDNTAPDPMTGFGASPGHEKLVMSWDDPSGLDAHFYGVKVQYDAWEDYPYYDDPEPLYPMDHTSGDGTAYDSPGLVMYWEHTETTRDVYYLGAFAYDYAMNYGPADPGAQDRSTNYWLGDVATNGGDWGYNGYVSDFDIDKLAGIYGVASPAGNDAECDVGPTDDHSRVGIPEPDTFVQFEDLMVFAMNYDVVEPLVVPILPVPSESGRELALSLSERSAGFDGELEVALAVEGNVDQVKGLSAELLFDATELEFVSARLTDAMSTPVAPVFFWHGANESSVELDLAVLGTGVTLGGSGDVAILTFRILSDEHSIGFGKTALRGADNEELDADLEGYDSKLELPTVFSLFPNVPNPFAESASIAYHVPHRSDVSIRVYDISGRLVRTLVDDATEPGRHLVVWDGRDESGEAIGSGVYFCTMNACGSRLTRKMILLK